MTTKSNQIQLVVLDMAGTTVRDDDAVNRCLREALIAGGVPISPSAVNEVMGLPKPIAIRLILERTGLDRPNLEVETERIHEDFRRRMIYFYQTDPGVVPTDGAMEVLTELRQAGLVLALDTGFSRQIVDVILRRLGWTDERLIHHTVASDEVAHGRPHPDLIRRAMQLAGVDDPARVAKVGDTPADLQQGYAAGCRLVVGVTNGTHTRAQLEPYPHTHLIGSLKELPGVVLQSGNRV